MLPLPLGYAWPLPARQPLEAVASCFQGRGFLYGHTLWLDALRIQRPLVHFPAA